MVTKIGKLTGKVLGHMGRGHNGTNMARGKILVENCLKAWRSFM